jgi:hypothetical protein
MNYLIRFQKGTLPWQLYLKHFRWEAFPVTILVWITLIQEWSNVATVCCRNVFPSISNWYRFLADIIQCFLVKWEYIWNTPYANFLEDVFMNCFRTSQHLDMLFTKMMLVVNVYICDSCLELVSDFIVAFGRPVAPIITHPGFGRACCLCCKVTRGRSQLKHWLHCAVLQWISLWLHG